MDVEVVEPPHRHHAVGEHWLDKVLPVSAILISVVSIWIAYHHGEVMQKLVDQNERLVAANSLPHIALEVRDPVDNRGLAQLNFVASNAGVGPAEIRSVEMLLDGKPVSNSRELLKGCCNLDTSEYRRAPLEGIMLRPGESRLFLAVDSRPVIGRPAFDRFYKAWLADRIETRVCYCSVFEDCWTRTSEAGSRPRPVGKQCPAPKLAYTR